MQHGQENDLLYIEGKSSIGKHLRDHLSDPELLLQSLENQLRTDTYITLYLEFAFLAQINEFQPATKPQQSLSQSIELPTFGELIYPAQGAEDFLYDLPFLAVILRDLKVAVFSV